MTNENVVVVMRG